MLKTNLTIPNEIVLALNLQPDLLISEIKLAAAIKLFELGRISSGAAALLAGIPKVSFLHKLGDYGVNTFDITEDELKEDIKNA